MTGRRHVAHARTEHTHTHTHKWDRGALRFSRLHAALDAPARQSSMAKRLRRRIVCEKAFARRRTRKEASSGAGVRRS